MRGCTGGSAPPAPCLRAGGVHGVLRLRVLWGMHPAPLAGVTHLGKETREAEMSSLWVPLVCLTTNQHFSEAGNKLAAARSGWLHLPLGTWHTDQAWWLCCLCLEEPLQ